jgi:hypothetical protein
VANVPAPTSAHLGLSKMKRTKPRANPALLDSYNPMLAEVIVIHAKQERPVLQTHLCATTLQIVRKECMLVEQKQYVLPVELESTVAKSHRFQNQHVFVVSLENTMVKLDRLLKQIVQTVNKVSTMAN